MHAASQVTGGPLKREFYRASNPTGMRSAGSTISIPTKLLATGVACAVTLLVCGTAATVVVASEAPSRLSTPLREGVRASGTIPPAGQVFLEMGATSAAVRSLATEEANPHSRAAEALAADTTQHPKLRVDALAAIALGGCGSLPEVVFGFRTLRREAMVRAVASLADIEGGPEAGARYLHFLDYAMALREVRGAPPEGTVLERNTLLNAFAWIVPPGVRARAFLCLQQNL